MDGGDDNVCKAIEDLIEDTKTATKAEVEVNTIFELRRDGLLDRKMAADRLGLSVEEYTKREDKYFCSLEGKKEASASSWFLGLPEYRILYSLRKNRTEED